MKAHPRADGYPRAAVGAIQGRCDGYVGIFQTHNFGQRKNEFFRVDEADYAWRLFDGLYRRRVWQDRDRWGDADYSGNPPLGAAGILPFDAADAEFAKYRFLFFLGRNVMDDALYAKLVRYVRGGGTLMLAACHLDCQDVPKGPFAAYNGGDWSELVGVKVGKGRLTHLPHGMKFVRNPAPGWKFQPLTNMWDPDFIEGGFDIPDLKATTAVPFAVTGWLFPNMDKLCWMLTGMIGPFVCILMMKVYRESFFVLIRTPQYVFGVITLFAYVGMQIAVWTWMNAYGQKELGVSPETSANYYILAIAIHILNCWAASYAMKWIAPWKIMAAYCLGGLACSLGTVYLPSTVLFSVAGLPFSANILTLMGCSFFMAILFPTIYGMALGGLDPKCFKLGGPGMIMAILGGAVITPWMASVISAKESVFFSLVPLADFTWDANLRTSSGAIRASFFIPIICFIAMFLYATVFGPMKKKES